MRVHHSETAVPGPPDDASFGCESKNPFAAPFDQGIEITPFTMFSSFEKKLCGCLMGSCNSLREIPRLASLWQSKQLNLEDMVTNRRPLEEINEAFDDLRAGRGIRTVLKI